MRRRIVRHRTGIRRFGAVALALLMLGAVLLTSTAGATPPQPPAVPTYPHGARTGVAAVDTVLAHVEKRDAGALVDLVVYQWLPCARRFPGGVFPRPPRCRDGEPTGTLVAVVRVGTGNGCSGGYRREDEMEGLLGAFIDPSPRTYAVYQSRQRDFWVERDSYGLLFAFELGTPRSYAASLTVTPRGRISAMIVRYSCASLAAVWARTKCPVLLPPKRR